MTLAPEFACKPECLRLYAPRDGDAVWAHHRHAQHDTPPYAVTAKTVAPLAEECQYPGSLGQLGWKRCHCDGARRMSTSTSATSDCVVRATSSRSDPRRATSTGGRITA